MKHLSGYFEKIMPTVDVIVDYIGEIRYFGNCHYSFSCYVSYLGLHEFHNKPFWPVFSIN